jgi:alpha-1,2-mannosyltransferase
VHNNLAHQDVLARGIRRPPALAGRSQTRWLPTPLATLVACALAGALLHLVLWQVSEPATLFSDLYKAYFPAAEVLWDVGLQANFPFTEMGAGGFVNVPVLAWLFVPLVPLGEEGAGWVFLAIGAAATALAYLLLRRMARPGTEAAPLVLLFLVNGPLVNTLREGNTTHFVLLMMVLALMLLQRGSYFGAGVLLGLCAVIKLPLLLYGAYFLLRRRWMVVAGGASAIVSILLLSVAAFGLDNNISWFNWCVEPFLGGIIPAFNVQSVDAFAVRLITGTSRLSNWDPMDVPMVYRVVRQILFAAALGYVAWLLLRAGASSVEPPRSETGRMREMLEFALILNIALVLSPISWSHYYALLLLPWGLYLGGRLPWPTDALSRRLLWSGMVLCSLPIVVLPLRADLIGEIAARTLVSACFAGGVAMLAALMRQLYQLGTSPDLAARDAHRP